MSEVGEMVPMKMRKKYIGKEEADTRPVAIQVLEKVYDFFSGSFGSHYKDKDIDNYGLVDEKYAKERTGNGIGKDVLAMFDMLTGETYLTTNPKNRDPLTRKLALYHELFHEWEHKSGTDLDKYGMDSEAFADLYALDRLFREEGRGIEKEIRKKGLVEDDVLKLYDTNFKNEKLFKEIDLGLAA